MTTIYDRIKSWGRWFTQSTSISVTPATSPVVAPVPAPTPGATQLRGTNLVGMEGGYTFPSTGPRPGTEYPVHTTAMVDYFASKGATIIRLLFSWERMQASLYGTVPAYQTYFNDYKRVVDYATSKGITVLIEPWQLSVKGDTGGCTWKGLPVNDIYSFADFWARMARIFKDNSRVQIGLVNEPNRTSTMGWFTTAQKCVDYIRAAGFTGTIVIPGNGWSGPQSWLQNWYDTDATKRSNAYGWLNANGTGNPLWDPLGKLVVGVHTYADSGGGGGTTEVVSPTITRERVKVVVDWARLYNLKVFIGEVGMYAGAPNAKANWADFINYANSVKDVLTGYAFWAAGPWWKDPAAGGGGHFSITPTNMSSVPYSGDSINMQMIGKFT